LALPQRAQARAEKLITIRRAWHLTVKPAFLNNLSCCGA